MNFNRKTPISAFTLVELLIFLGLFSLISVAFITVLITVTRVQVQQSSAVEVGTQSQALLQKIQYYVEQSSLIDMPQDTATSTLKLFTGAIAQDPTYITLQNGIVYLQQTATGTLQPLTSNRVTVSNLTFTRRANAPSHDSVSVAFTIAYNSSNLQQAFSQMLETSIARVSAATFDSNVVPSSTATYNLGVAGNIWSSVNQNLYFSGTNIGIGIASPNEALDLNGRLYFEPSSAPSSTANRLYNVSGNLYWNGIPWGNSATGTPFYFPYWSASGTALSATSSIFISSSTGNVGIGTGSPSNKLVVGNDLGLGAAGGNVFTVGNTSGYSQIVLGNSSTNFGNLYWDNTNNVLNFFTAVGGTGYSTMTMKSGNVGIGTTNPAVKLDISGTGGPQILRIEKTDETGGGRSQLDISGYRTSDNDLAAINFLNGVTGVGAQISSNRIGANNSADLRFSTINAGSYNLNAMYISQVGNVGIGNTNPGYTLTVNGTAWVTGGSWSGSDIRWKQNIVPLTNALDKVDQLQAVTYDWRQNEFPDMKFASGTQIGFIAQDVKPLFPDLVTTNNQGYEGIAYDKFVPVLAESIKEQQAEIDALKSQNAALESQIKTLMK